MALYLWRPGKDPGLDHELIWGGVGLLAFAAARFVPLPFFSLFICPFRRITGIPCLTCGMTRTLLGTVRLEWADAFLLSPLWTLSWILGGLYLAYALVVVAARLPRVRIRVKNPRVRLALRVILPALVLANWIYMIIHGV